MPETSLKDQIKKIVELQKIDEEVYRLRGDTQEKPAIIEQLKEEFEENKKRLQELQEKVKDVQVKRRNHELDMASKEGEIAKANAQLAQLKTNKEYKAKLEEIAHINADKSIIEEKILVSYDESDALNAEVEKEKVKVSEIEKEYIVKKKEVEDEIKVMEDRVKVLISQREQALNGIDPNYLSRYERILENKGGVAIVPVQGNTCAGCFMNVTSQKINALKMSDQLVECEMCSRILYLEEEL